MKKLKSFFGSLGSILLIYTLVFVGTIVSCSRSEEPKEATNGEKTIYVFKAEPKLSKVPESASFEELMKTYTALAKKNKAYGDFHSYESFAQGVEGYINGSVDSVDLSKRIKRLNKKEKELWKITLAQFDKTKKKEKIIIMLK